MTGYAYLNDNGCLVGSVHQSPAHSVEGGGGWHFVPAVTPCAKTQGDVIIAPASSWLSYTPTIPKRSGSPRKAASQRTNKFLYWAGRRRRRDFRR